ncbi:hypothetical protein PV-S19_0337 [Pacmanvirus S19]|nr:hypothetical protein PV-S19_0337 [Pacmanvirus S19]
MQNEEEVLNAIENAAGDEVPVENAPADVKKKPGRPKKKVANVPVEVHGIVDKPVNDDDLLEMVYCNPTMFKKLLQLYKSFEVSEVEMYFDPNGAKIITKDHLKKSTIYTTIDGRCMNLYYCKEPVRVCVKRDNLEKILGTLGKNHYKITFILKEDHRSNMYLVVKDIEYNNDDSYEIDVVFKPEDPAQRENRDDDSNYPIKFKISSKHFKTKLNNIRKISPTFTIQKCGDEPLQFTFDKAQMVNWVGVYNDPEKIELKSTITDDEIFNVSVPIDWIKPFSNSNIGDDVYIAADKREKMSFMTMLDKKDIGYAACVKVYTEIKDYRRGPRAEPPAQ